MKKIGIVFFFLLSFASLGGAQEESDWASSTSAPAPKIIESPEGMKFIPPTKEDKNWVEDTFQLPEEDGLEGCIYAASFSYPSLCFDRKGKTIFNYDRGDDQSVLDKIIREQGKQNGRYNKLPKK